MTSMSIEANCPARDGRAALPHAPSSSSPSDEKRNVTGGRTAVINVVGLTDALIGEHTPHPRVRRRGDKASIEPFPAVSAPPNPHPTGTTPHAHGIVGNGWYNRELAEVQFWKQSNHLVRGKKIWEELRERDPNFTCAKLFWWYNMYSTTDFSITPRPMYPADGRKVFDIYTHPGNIRRDIQRDLGPFPFPCFWGPAAGVDTPQGSADAVSRWIAGISGNGLSSSQPHTEPDLFAAPGL